MIKKVCSVILVLVICIQMGNNFSWVYAADNRIESAKMVTGKVSQPEQQRNRTSAEGIEIQVFSSERDESVIYEDLEIYNSTYEFSVYCDTAGEYSFIPPSKDYSVAVNLASLPEKTGVSDSVMLIKQGENIKDIELCEIARIEVDYESEDIVVKAYSEQGDEIHTLCTESETEEAQSYSYLRKDGEKIAGVPTSLIDISDLQCLSKNVQVNVNGVGCEVPYIYDLNDLDISERIALLYRLKIISEEDKISLYCDLFSNPPEGLEVLCGTSIIGEIEKYCEQNRSSKDANVQELVQKAENVSRSHVGPYLQEGLFNVNIGSGDFYYQLHYEAGTGGPDIVVLSSVAATVRDIHNFFVNNGFQAPRKPIGEEYYHIYLISGFDYYGLTHTQSELITTAASYIEVKFNAGEQYNVTTRNVTPFFKFTLAHEMYHAISFTYRTGMDEWFSESFATWAGIRYMQDGESASDYVNHYMSATNISPDDMENWVPYGFCVFPLTLDEYNGGIPTILAILEATESTSNEYTAIRNGITEANQSYDTIEQAFTACSLYISRPTEFYSKATSSWNEASCDLRSDTGTYTVTGDHFTSSRYTYIRSASSAKVLSISIRKNSGSRGCGLVRIKFDGTTEVVGASTSTSDMITYNISNYGPTYFRVILSLANISTSADNLNCTVTSSLN